MSTYDISESSAQHQVSPLLTTLPDQLKGGAGLHRSYTNTLLATCISKLGKALLQEISRFLIILPDHGWTGRVCLRARILHDTRSRQISAAGAQPPRCLLASPVLLRRPKCLACSGGSLQPSKGVVRQFGKHTRDLPLSLIDFCALGRE